MTVLPEWPIMDEGVPREDGQVEYLSNGMKVLDRHHFAPIKVMPGDVLECTYSRKWTMAGATIHKQDIPLAMHRVTEHQTVDTAIIVELDDGSLTALGLKTGIAGIFGEGADE